MVLQKIAQGIIEASVKYGPRVANSEKLVLNYAWRGFKHKSSIVAGIRTGLVSGGITGSLINETADNPEVAKIPPYIKPSTYSQNKTRGRPGRFSNRYTRHKCAPYRGKRYSRFK